MKFYPIVILIIGYWGSAYGQRLNSTLYANPYYQSALKNHKIDRYDLVINHLQKIDTAGLAKNLSLWAEYHWLLSNSYSQIGKKDITEKIYESILPVLLNSPPIKYDSIWSELFYDMCSFYTDNGAEFIVNELIEKAMALVVSTTGENSLEWAKLLSLLGYLKAKVMGDHDTGVLLLRKSLSIWLDNQKEKHVETARIYSKLSNSERYRKNKVLALKYGQKCLEIYSSINTRNKNKMIAESYMSLAITYYYYDEYDTAISYYWKAIDIMKKMPPILSNSFINGYSLIGDCYYQKGDYLKAWDHYQIALKSYKKAFGPTHPKLGMIYGNMLAILIKLERFEEAESFSEKVNSIVNYDPNLPNPFSNVLQRRANLVTMLYFQAKNHFFWYRQNGNQSLLEKACHGFDRIVQLIETIHADYEESGSKQYLLDLYYYVFEMALNAHYEWYRVSGDPAVFERALGYTERSRAILLTEALRRQDAGYAAGVPNSLRQQLAQLRKDIVDMQNQEYLLKKQGKEDSPEMRVLYQRLYDLNEQRRILEADIKKRFPAYATAGQRPEPPSVAQIQARLKPNEAWITYFAGEDDMYAFVVQPQSVAFVHIPKNFPLEQWVEELRNAIYDYPMQRSDSLFHLYKTRAWELYQKLLQPLPPLPSRLILALDGVLEYVPFEALFYAEAADCNGRNCPYLLHRHIISHARAASLWLRRDNPKPSVKRKILAYAPRFPAPAVQDGTMASRRSELGPLTYNETEVRQIGRYFPVRIVRSAKASKEAFANSLSNYAVLHLATHAKANDKDGDLSFIAFTPSPKDTAHESYLLVRELYAMLLPADLVVLSACETGIGEIKRGEGLVSLAYGFNHAGARSLITSLWRVSDRETADLMKRFYAGLRKKLPKDEALCQAKRAYLAEQTGWKAHPFFWAAFVAQGDMAPLDLPVPVPAWLWALAGVALALAVWAGWRKWQR